MTAYSTYHESGIEWVGPIPESWIVRPMFAVVDTVKAKNSALAETNLLSLSHGRIIRKDIDTNEGLLPESFDTYQVVERDDIVFRFTDLQNDKRSLRSALVGERGIITSAYLAVRPRAHSPSYLSYLTRAYDHQKVFYAMGGGLRQSMKFDDVRRLPLLFPPLEEQRQIAAYLDRESGKIDELIAKQEQLIETLAERRHVLVNDLVTRGLDPHAPLTQSGALGTSRLPTHWNAISLVRAAPHRVDYRGATPNKTLSGVQLVTARNVKSGWIDYETSREFVAEDDYLEVMRRGLPEVGDVLLTMEAPLGNVALVDRVDVAFAQRVVKFRLNPDLALPEFILWAMNSSYFQQQLQSKATGSTAIGLKASKLVELVVALPPLVEQAQIAAHLETETRRLDRLMLRSRELAQALGERRAALIIAAVTGKIDVRSSQSEGVSA